MQIGDTVAVAGCKSGSGSLGGAGRHLSGVSFDRDRAGDIAIYITVAESVYRVGGSVAV